jgi:phosphomannomutase
LAFICEDGEMFGEYTLVADYDYIVKNTRNTVSNMSSSRALRDVTNSHNGSYKRVLGEVNVVELMKK